MGSFIPISPVTDDRDRRHASVAYDQENDRYLVVYSYDVHGDHSDWDVVGRFLRGTGIDPSWHEFHVAGTNRNELHPRAAFSTLSRKFLVTWWTQNAGPPTVDGSLFGFGESPTWFNVAEHATDDRLEPDVAYEPFADSFLVVYSSSRDIFATLVGSDGAVGSEVTVAGWPGAESAPAVASCANSQYLVAWHSTVAPDDNDVYVRFLLGDGTVNSAPIRLARTSADEQRPEIACSRGTSSSGGMHYLVVFEQQYDSTSGPYGIEGQRVSPHTGGVAPDFHIRRPWSDEIGEVATQPAVAGGLSGWLVAWEHDRKTGSSTHFQDIRGRVVMREILFADGFESGNLLAWSASLP